MVLYEMIDYDLLRVIWWLLLAILLIGFALTDGFDMGVGALLPFVARTDIERRVAINSIAPTWEGNQVWFILGGGAIFAAFPPLYAVSFSGFYLAMFVVLAALILRPVAFKYRSKREDPRWRSTWDWALFIGGFVPALIFGVAVGNVLQGVPFRLTDSLMPIYEGSFFGLLNPFALLAGLVSVAMLVMHGAAWLALRAEGIVATRARSYGSVAALAVVVLYPLAGVWMAFGIDAYAFVGEVPVNGDSNPLVTEVAHGGSWLAAYAERPWIAIAPIMGIVGAALVWKGIRGKREGLTFLASKMSIVGVIGSVGLTMFPFILPSSIQPDASLTLWDSSSSHMTLFVMLVSTIIFLPLVLAYTAWVYKVLWGPVSEETIRRDSETAY